MSSWYCAIDKNASQTFPIRIKKILLFFTAGIFIGVGWEGEAVGHFENTLFVQTEQLAGDIAREGFSAVLDNLEHNL